MNSITAPRPDNWSRRKLMGAAAAAGAAATVAWLGTPSALAEPGSGQPAGRRRLVPVPEHAKPPQIPAKGYLLDDLGGGVYGVRYGTYQSMFLVTHAGVVVVDAPAGLGDKLLAAIDEVTQRRVTHVVYSHSHADHIGSASLFPDNAHYVAHQLTGQLLRRAGDPRRPVPTTTFAGHRHVLHVGGERLVLEYRGDNHQAGNLFIYAPEQRVLMLVDVVTPRWTPFFRLGLTPNVRAYLDATQQILRYDFRTLIAGHAGHFGIRADVETHGRYLTDLQAAVGEALRTVDPADAAKGIDPDNYQGSGKAYFDAVAARSAELMPATWLTQLGGADVYLRDNATAIMFNMLID